MSVSIEEKKRKNNWIFLVSLKSDVSAVINNLLDKIELETLSDSATNFTSFVVDDIITKIRLAAIKPKYSSSADEVSSASLSSSIVDVPSATSSRPLSPSQTINDFSQPLTPIDKQILDDIELYSRELAQEFVVSIEKLTSSLHNMSATSVCCLQTYRDAIGGKLNETIEANIKAMYSFMAQAEQLNLQMTPIYELQKKINYIKHLLDILSQSI